MSIYNIKFFKDGNMIFETNINHNLTYKALLYAEAEATNKLRSAFVYDQVEINEIKQ